MTATADGTGSRRDTATPRLGVGKLVRNLSDEHTYKTVVGYPPVPREQP